MSARDAIRKATLGQGKRDNKIVSVNGVEVEVRAPSVRYRAAILREAGVKPGMDEAQVDMFQLMAIAITMMVYVPNSDELVYERADVDGLLDSAATGESAFFDELGKACVTLLGLAKSREEVEKNS